MQEFTTFEGRVLSYVDHYLLDLLRLLVREPSVVGVEDAFFRILRRELEEFDVRVTRYHGLLVAEGNAPTSHYLSAHVDRHGLLCTGPNEFQYAAFVAANRGELTGDSISEQLMEQIAGRVHGQRVQAHAPFTGTYLGQGQIRESSICPRRKNLIFEIDGLNYLQPGTPVSFINRLQIDRGQIRTQLDNVVSVALLIELIRRGYQGTAMFTAGEEAGKSWRYAVEWFQRHDTRTNRLIVLDTSPFPSVEDMRKQDVVLRNQDASAVFDAQVTEQIAELCQSMGIGYCFKDEWVKQQNVNRERPMSLGRTELGRIMNATQGEVRGTTLQLPTTSYHTANETAELSSLESMLRLLLRLCDLS